MRFVGFGVRAIEYNSGELYTHMKVQLFISNFEVATSDTIPARLPWVPNWKIDVKFGQE